MSVIGTKRTCPQVTWTPDKLALTRASASCRGRHYFTQSFNGTAGRFGQFIVPAKNSDIPAL